MFKTPFNLSPTVRQKADQLYFHCKHNVRIYRELCVRAAAVHVFILRCDIVMSEVYMESH